MTTPDQLDFPRDPADQARNPADRAIRRSRRDFWRSAPRPPVSAWLRVFRPAKACRFEVLLPAEAAGDVDAARRALDESDRIEAAWSVFRDDSQLTAINRRAAVDRCPVEPELAALLERCARLSAATEGAFDITATPLSRCWQLLQRQGRLPAPDAIAAARAHTGHALVDLRLDAGGDGGATPSWTVGFTRTGVELNLGAIGKGYAVGRVAAALARDGVGCALVSAGDSSVEAVGAPPRGWPIALRGGVDCQRLWLRHGAMATSGAGEQGFLHEGVRLGHVIDPRTGWPARGVSRVTVVAPDAADADALSTAFFVGGPALAERCLADRDDVLAVFLLDGSTAPRIMGRASGATVEV